MEENQAEIILQGRLDGRQRNRLKRLLDMEYTPKELAEEIGVNLDQIYRVYVPGGCPHQRKERNHIHINGKEFRLWFEQVYKKRPMEADQAFCLTCKKAVKIVNPVRKQIKNLVYDLCECLNCGRHLTRIVDHKRKKQ